MTDDSLPVHETLDLNRHGVIEASAGTGKTYTIQNLVVRLLNEKEIQLDQILVLTFTEKATAELKYKIRGQISESLDKGKLEPAAKQRLQHALDQFDSAQIFTIHGFCQRVLQQYAFENDESFRLELLTNDDDIYRRLLKEQQRKQWPDIHGKNLFEILQVSGFDADDTWDSTVLKLARSFVDSVQPSDVTIPDPPALNLDEMTRKLHGALDKLVAAVGAIDPVRWEQSDLVLKYLQLNINRQTRKARIRAILIPLLKLLEQHKKTPLKISDAMEFICLSCNAAGFKEKGFASIGEGHMVGKFFALDRIVDELKELESLKSLRHYLTVQTMRTLKTDVEAHKKEYGLYGFDDMLRRLDSALDEKKSRKSAALLKQKLRERYSFALLDESQDTDRIQWNILKRIFVDEPGVDSTRRLFLIGDPKQAIYAFRGADVNVYLAARECLTKQAGAQSVPLARNWRSTPDLQNALNELFSAEWQAGDDGASKESWFGDANAQIRYSQVEPVDDTERKSALIYDKSGMTPITVVDLSECGGVSSMRERLAEYIACEIGRVINGSGGPAIRLKLHSGQVRPINLSDICILVRTSKEALPIEAALNKLGIPHSFYKKQGLYQSDEAVHLSYLFAAIAFADNAQAFHKALLTHFFRIPANELKHYTNLPPENPIKRLFEKWRHLAEKRNWAALFSSIIDDTGVVLAFSAIEDSDSTEESAAADTERRTANYLQIMEDLEVDARRRHLDFIGILERLNRYRRRSIDLGQDTDIHRIETEKPKVQIMTMHVSKGLEFPIVFIAGGFGSAPQSFCYKFHNQEGRIVYDLTRNPRHKALHDAEQDAEDRRLFYVALTRAQYKLVVPRVENLHRKTPLTTFVCPAVSNAWLKYDPQVVRTIHLGGDDQKIPAESKLPSARTTDSDPELFALKNSLTNIDLMAEIDAGAIRARTLTLESYSSLKHDTSSHKRAFGEEAPPKAADETEIEIPIVPRSPVETLDLPRGKETGSFLHDVLEHLDYAALAKCTDWNTLAGDSEFRALLATAARRNHEFEWQAHAKTIARLVCNVLQTRLNPEGFTLSTLKRAARRHEIEFHFPLPRGLRLDQDLLEELEIELQGTERDGFLIGFIDLVFRYKGEDGTDRYAILDWKSDWLEDYSPRAMQTCMDDKGYTLQYKIYTLALSRWLAQCGLDFDMHFGGIYYLFLRGIGMNPVNAGAGIFRPDEPPDLVKWEKELFGILNQRVQA